MTKEALGGTNDRLKCRQQATSLCILTVSLFFLSSHLFARTPDPTTKLIVATESAVEKLNATPVIADTTIRGRIADSTGSGISGVSVVEKGTRNGTVTNASGDFTLNNVKPNATIVISSVGYQTSEVRLTRGQTALSFTLLPEAGTLGDVVVTGFQRISKKNFTGSAVRLKAEDIKIEGLADVSRMLEGRAAGVTVQNVSGTFGAAPKVRVRGATSINGDNKPLWVVDGVVLEDVINVSNEQLSSGDPATLLGSAVAGLNANDIESFDILKDAAAAALYGARAMNGVVVITTKRGRVGKPSVSYVGNFSTQLKPNYSNYNIMNSAQQMSVLGDMERKGWLTSDVASRGDAGVYGKMYDLINTYDETTGQFGLQNTTEARREFLLRYANANTDWFDILFRNPLIQEHSLSLSAGTDRSQNYFSTSLYSDNGWTLADDVKRYTLNFRNNYKFSERLSGGFNTVGSVRQQKAPGSLSRISNPVEGKFDRDFDINPFSYALNTSRTMTAYDEDGNQEYFKRNFAPFNIINELDNNRLKLNVLDLKLQGDLNYRISKALRYEFLGAVRYVKSSQEHEITENANMANAYRAAGNSTIRNANKFLYRDPDNPEALPEVVLPYGGFYNRVENNLLNYEFRNSLNYIQTFSDLHNVNVLVGQQVKYSDRQNFSNTGYGYQYENGGTPFTDYRILKQTIENNFPYFDMSKEYDRFAAFYATAAYIFNKKYNLTGTVRYDGSNRLGESKSARWLPTWSVGASWNVEAEPFMENVEAVNNLTVRAAYGLTASMGPATNSTIVLKNAITRRPYLSEQESVIQLINLENSELTWEKLYTANVGIDAGLFDRRLNVSVDAYKRNSFDLISRIKTSGIGGEQYKVANYADMKSHGIEGSIGGEVIRRRDWGWRTYATFGYNQTEITNAKNEPNIFDLVRAEGGNIEGFPVNSLFSIKFENLVSNTGVPQFISEKGDLSQDVYLQDDNINYLVYNGPIDPTISGGFSNTFNYKSLSLNFFLTYQAGNKIRLYNSFKSIYTDLDAMPKEFFDRWVQPGEETVTDVPSIMEALLESRTGAIYPFNNYNYSTQRVANGSFVRLKTVALTYQIPQSLIKRIGISSFSVTGTATNPWLIYSDKKLKGQDPEFFNSGGVAQPIQKQFTLSLKVGI